MRALYPVLTCLWLLAGNLAVQAAPLRVLIWADYLAPGVIDAFTAETGQAVVVDTYDRADLTEALLLARGSGYDVAVVSSEFIGRLSAAGALQQLRPGLLPGLDAIEPALLARLAAIDPGHRYARPYLWGTLGVAFDADALDRRLETTERDSWSMVFDPATIARLADCGVAMVDSVEEIIAAVLLWKGMDPNLRSQDADMAAMQVLQSIAPYVKAYTSSVIEQLMEGQLCLVVGWSVDALAAAAEAPERDVRFVVPREGGLVWADLFVVPIDAQQPEAAHGFIAHMLKPAISAASATHNLSASPVSAALPLMSSAAREAAEHQAVALDDPRLVMLRSISPERKAALLSAWTRLRFAPITQSCTDECPDSLLLR